MKCELCGKENKENALFCAECGKALKDHPIDLDLTEINVPAASRKAHIVKVSAKKTENASAAQQQPSAAEEKPAEAPADIAAEKTVLFSQAAAAEQEAPATEQKAPATEQPEMPAVEQQDTPVSTPEEPEVPEGELIELTPAFGQSTAPAAKDPREEPMRIGNWIVVFILSMIPVVGTVMLFVWAFSSRTNKSKKSYAQAALIFSAILLVLSVAATFAYAALFHVNLSDMLPH
ncbi:MAG: zinc ribbon domain-containing protein [Clostridia bacterium]|nr:zinc ribbon domain-containing protein [Clostridia bacterium]